MDFVELGRIEICYRRTEVDRAIHPADDMWQAGPDWYWSVGSSGVTCVLRALSATALPRVGSILDLACNYGRTGRHLRAAFPDVPIWFCDIHDGAAFCARQFGGEAIIAGPELTTVSLPKVDVIWIGSLFTHLTEAKTRSWLHYLAEHLNSHGVIVATFHGRRSAELFSTQLPDLVRRTWPVAKSAGWGYVPYDDAAPDWGFSMNTVTKLAEIAEAVPGLHIANLTEAAWGGNHDVLALARE